MEMAAEAALEAALAKSYTAIVDPANPSVRTLAHAVSAVDDKEGWDAGSCQ